MCQRRSKPGVNHTPPGIPVHFTVSPLAGTFSLFLKPRPCPSLQMQWPPGHFPSVSPPSQGTQHGQELLPTLMPQSQLCERGSWVPS